MTALHYKIKKEFDIQTIIKVECTVCHKSYEARCGVEDKFPGEFICHHCGETSLHNIVPFEANK